MNDLHLLLLATTAIALFVGATTLAYRTAIRYLRNRLRNRVLRAMPPWKRDDWSARSWHQEMMMRLYDTKPEDRPIIVSIIKTEKGDGAMACTHPNGWPIGEDGYNYAKGTGLEILKTIAGAITLMELTGNKNCLSTLLILLEEERDRLNSTRTNNTLP